MTVCGPKVIVPDSGGSKAVTRRPRVVLPEPDSPTSPKNSPGGMSSETSRTARTSLLARPNRPFRPYTLDTPAMLSVAPSWSFRGDGFSVRVSTASVVSPAMAAASRVAEMVGKPSRRLTPSCGTQLSSARV